jgi:hypothetical protein
MVTFQPVLIKTLVNYLCCAYYALCRLLLVIRIYLFVLVIYSYSLFAIVVHLFCSLFDSFIRLIVRLYSSLILLLLLFIVHCF